MDNVTGAYAYTYVPGQISVSFVPFSRRSRITVPDSDYIPPVKDINTIPVQFLNNSHNGKISITAKRKIRRTIQIITSVVPKPRYFEKPAQMTGRLCLAFATFTLSSGQVHSDQILKKYILDPFLKCVIRRYGVISYIWRAEKQANGNLHFHIIWDRYIAWSQLTKLWNYFQNKLGYVDLYSSSQKEFYKDGFVFRSGWSNCSTIDKQRQAYLNGRLSGWVNPPSVNVQSLKTVTSVVAYLTKYMLKPSDTGIVAGRLWGCSSNLSKLKGSLGFSEGSVSSEINAICDLPGSVVYIADYYTVIYFDNKLVSPDKFPLLIDNWFMWVRSHFPAYSPPGFLPS